ncbi:MAG TPA: SulP family inorganic anion transporter, partial [bacterium]|nr:SulP family inorganic anion transporter [bacterium]
MGPKENKKDAGQVQPIFAPKLFSTLKNYSLALFWGDLSAGVTVGIVALPLAIAFAIASGVTPDRGLTTAIVAGFLISLLGGSRVQIGGPTGAFVVIVYGIVQRYGVNGLLICTLLAGAILILMGALRLGTIIKFIPYPLTVGFTAGIAVVIFSSQIKDFFGIRTEALPADFIEKWAVYFRTFHTLDWKTLVVALLSLAIILLWPRLDGKFSRRIPGSIVAILAMTALVHLFHIPIETIGSRFGSIPAGLPQPTWPQFSLEELKGLIGPAFTVALLGAI